MSSLFTVQNLLPGKLSAGVNVFLGMKSCPAEALDAFLGQQLPAVRMAHARSLPPGFAYSRRLYNSLHIDPTKHRLSAEALWRRLRDKNDFPRVNPLVDLTNFISLKSQISFGLYDLERVHGPLVIALGSENDRYQGIRKEMLNLKGKIVLRDDTGAFGNPSADSLRASVVENSSHVMQVLFFHVDDSLKMNVLSESSSLFQRFFCPDRIRSFLLETDKEQGILPEGETCKTNAAPTKFPSPA